MLYRPPARQVTALCLLLLAGCASRPPADPIGEPYVRGPVESITHHATASGLLVRGGPDSREPCGISATTDSRTGFFERLPDRELRRATISEIQIGDTVEVYVTGPVAESCPVQGYASTVVLVARPGPN
jgi:hypothetical protein